MSDLVGNPEDRFSRVEAHFITMICFDANDGMHYFNYNCMLKILKVIETIFYFVSLIRFTKENRY